MPPTRGFLINKLTKLVLPQFSKLVKIKAQNNRVLREYVLIPTAQTYNWCGVKMKLWKLIFRAPVYVPLLKENEAVELGANLFEKGIVLAIGVVAFIFEYARQTKNENKKLERQRQEKAELINSLSKMSFRVEDQDAQIRNIFITINCFLIIFYIILRQ